MTSEKRDKVQIVEPFVLFDNLAQGALTETNEGVQEWANQHELNIATVAEDNRKHLRDAIHLAHQKLKEHQSAGTLPQKVTTVEEANQIFDMFRDQYKLAGRNASTSEQNSSDKIRHANQMLTLHRQSSEA